MLITGYGVDNALSQVLYYHHTEEMDFATVSNRNVHSFIKNNKPDIIVGLQVYPDYRQLLKDSCVIIDTTKKSQYMYQELEPVWDNFISAQKISKTALLHGYLKAGKDTAKYASLANDIASYKYDDDLEKLRWFYDAVGHSVFVNRFITNDSLLLNKNETRLVLRYCKLQRETAEILMENFCVIKEPVCVCRAPFDMRKMVESTIIERHGEDITCIVLWDYSQDGTVNVSATSKSDLGSKLAESFGGNGYGKGGNWSVDTANVDMENDMSDNISRMIKDALDNMFEDSRREYYNDLQNKIEGNVDAKSMLE